MKIGELPAFLKDELSYPVDRTTVIAQIGSVEVEAPDERDTDTIATIIRSVGERRYDGPDELFDTIIGNLSDEYIGRKFYDDRGRGAEEADRGPSDEADVSF